ncbi:ABC transporter permease [Schaalia vaccimaxillae]|uniref:ABC transporter permease n=1 Tax=Schaalia vaccimaxillae TaxID=183916 RepID=UPI0003B61C11|nr:ABC transporter permease [Schaalia vaccimaxillae]
MSTTVDAKATKTTSPVGAFIKNNMQQLLVTVALVIIYIYFMIAAPNFADVSIFLDILLQTAFTGVMALGATFVIATSGIDLSVGTGMTMVAVMGGIFLSGDHMNLPLIVGLLGMIAVGALIGAINGSNIALLGLPPFIATLAMMMVCRGLALVVSDKATISIANKDYIALSTGSIFPSIPLADGKSASLSNAALILVILVIVAAFLMSKTVLGRYALAFGSNEEAARLSGVNVRMWKIIIYTVAGIFMAISAILYSARFGFVQPAEGAGMEMDAIAAAVIGGTSLAGGRASVPGALVGALIMMTLKKGLTMMGVASEWQMVVTGIVVMLAVFIDNIRRARENAA